MLLITSTQVLAATRAQFFGMQGMINIASPSLGEPDSDAKTMMNDMNVPVQGGLTGPGKSIVAEAQTLSYICGERGPGQVQCSIFIQRSEHSKLSPSLMKYEVFGETAATLHSQFNPNTEDGNYKFVSVDGLFQVEATPEHFLVQYQQ